MGANGKDLAAAHGEAVLVKAGALRSARSKSPRGVGTKAIMWLPGFMSSLGSFNAPPASGARER